MSRIISDRLQLNDILEKLPQDKKQYFISQIDPFHDKPLNVKGAPSTLNGNSTVLTLNQTKTVNAADFGIGAGKKWDLHVAMFPTVEPDVTFSGTMQKPANFVGKTSGTGTPQRTLYPLAMHADEHGTGEEITFVEPSGTATWIGLDNSSISTMVDANGHTQSRRFRLIGESFEIVDTTPELYKQGSCTVYSYPNTSYTGSNYTSYEVGALVTEVFGANKHLTMPPSNIATAVVQPNSVTWPAKDGCYVVGRKSALEVPFQKLDATPYLFHGSRPSTGDSTNGGQYAFISTRVVQEGGAAFPVASNAVFPYNLSGAYLTNLDSDYSSFRIRYRTMWEIIPDPSDATLTTLATPTMAWDQELEELIQHVLSTLPVGVRQTDNPSGEFWRGVLKTSSKILKAAMPLLTIADPRIAAAAGIASRASSDLAPLIPQNKKKQPPKATSKKKKA